MYAVIRAGGKQYRVAPGDVIRIERTPASEGNIEFQDILAVSPNAGEIARPEGKARVVGRVVEEGRGDKVLVFHFKRKKQYKKLRGHRQDFTAVRITEIAFDGQRFTAPEEPKREPKPKKTAPAVPAAEAAVPAASAPKAKAHAAEKKPAKPAMRHAAAKKAAPHKGAAHKPAAKKGGSKGKGGKK